MAASLWAAPGDNEPNEPNEPNKPKLNSDLLAGIPLRSIGPALMSGRIADLAIDPERPNTWYVAAGSGNLWKTVNAGTTWQPIFENYGSYSLGCVTIDPSNRHTLWVGTGEDVGGRHVGYGDGVYRSLDGGKGFKNMGLKESEHIARILVDPRDSDTVYVAAQGPLWSPGGERGLYKTTDGGQTWVCILKKGPYTGVTDVVFEPGRPDVLYAATHQRHRTVWALVNGGPESGIHKSVDGGQTWQELKGGLPGADKGKIGLAVSPQKPQVVYASIELAGRQGGIWRSENGGQSWRKMSDYTSGGTGPHYYQELFCDPHRFDVLYHANVHLGRTEDGGRTWQSVENSRKHVDNHAVAFHPADPDFLLVGCDGGLYRSYDRGRTYDFFGNLPLTQFYKVAADNDSPFYNIVGGTQDNSTQYGPSRTTNRSGIGNADWRIVIGGDGHDCAIDPRDPDTIYGESQQGYLRRVDRRTGESLDIRPRPAAGQEDLRFNWDAPILISPHSHTRLYFGSKLLHRSDNRGDSWTAISPDLSRNLDRYHQPHMERVWSLDSLYDTMAMSQYGNITSISESPLQEGLLYVGTDDGLIQVTEDGGANWRRIECIEGAPEAFFVNDIKADLHDVDTVVAVLDAHKFGDFRPYLIKSTDRGRTWQSLTGDLPQRQILWRFVQDHVCPELCFLGAEFGLYVTFDGGAHWLKLKGGVPTIPFRDLEIQARENDLIGATFGRGFYVLDDYSYLRRLSSESLTRNDFMLFPIRKTPLYVPERGRQGAQGDRFFSAPNPPHGAVFTYYLRDSLQTLQQQRRRQEAKIRKQGGDTPYPGWDRLKEEEQEEAPRLTLVIRDGQGRVVSRVAGSTAAGLHRANWDLHHTSSATVGGSGPLVTPGRYTVQAEQRFRGRVATLGPARSFRVVPLHRKVRSPEERQSDLAYYCQVAALHRVVSGTTRKADEVLEQLRDIKRALQQSDQDLPDLYDEVRRLELQLQDLRLSLAGGSIQSRYDEPDQLSVSRRIGSAGSTAGSSFGPTETQRQDFRIAQQEFEAIQAQIHQCIDVDFPSLQRKLEAAKLPWTSGRPLPQP
jgi:photosystem II stability/assembly factor-like uncharacterized protein